MHLTIDAKFLIRDAVAWSGCAAWRSLSELAKDAHQSAAYDEAYPEHRTFSGELIGGPRLAKIARKAERQYRIASWVLRRVYEGREEYDRLAKETAEAAEYERIMRVSP